MTDNKRERIAKVLLATFRNIWCDRESDYEPFFNCDKCELKMDDGRCGVKLKCFCTQKNTKTNIQRERF